MCFNGKNIPLPFFAETTETTETTGHTHEKHKTKHNMPQYRQYPQIFDFKATLSDFLLSDDMFIIFTKTIALRATTHLYELRIINASYKSSVRATQYSAGREPCVKMFSTLIECRRYERIKFIYGKNKCAVLTGLKYYNNLIYTGLTPCANMYRPLRGYYLRNLTYQLN